MTTPAREPCRSGKRKSDGDDGGGVSVIRLMQAVLVIQFVLHAVSVKMTKSRSQIPRKRFQSDKFNRCLIRSHILTQRAGLQ